MLYCTSCKVNIVGAHKYCPLCLGDVTGTPKPEAQVFPRLKAVDPKMWVFYALIRLLAIGAAIACVVINILVPSQGWWSLFVVAGIACGWLVIAVAIQKKRNLMKNIVWQLAILSALAVLWDIFTGWYGWSIAYVFPYSCVAAMSAMLLLSMILDLPPRDYISYMLLDLLFGIVPIVFLLTGILATPVPSIICVACSAFFMVALLLFQGKAMYLEIRKKLHL